MMPQFQVLISLAIVVVFVGFTLYDFSNIKHRFGPDDAIPAAVQLYLDFLNLFLALIQYFDGDEWRRWLATAGLILATKQTSQLLR